MFSVFKAVPARLIVGIMMFLASWVNYITRAHINIIIIAMVTQNSSVTSVKSECDAFKNNTNSMYIETSNFDESRRWRQEDVVTFDWTAQEQAYVLSSYFWSYTITCIMGGMVAEATSPRLLVLCITLLCGIGDFLSPHAAQLHYIALVAVRFVVGGASGMLFPALHKLLVHWAPPDERGLFVSGLLGGAIGTVFTWSLVGPFLESFPWNYAFYMTGTIVISWCLFWWFLVYDSPVVHPRISEAEKEYILKVTSDKVEQSVTKRPLPPFRSILTSFPFLAMIVLIFGNGFGIYFVMTAAPKYVSTALGFNLSSTGILTSLPYLARMTFSLVFGAIGDRIVRSNRFSTTFIRKFFTVFSHIIPGLLLLSMGYTGCAPILSIAIITFALGFNGISAITALSNHIDLAPNFAATLYGIANGIANSTGFLTPLVTAYFTKNGNGLADWRPVFITGASLYMGTGLYFIVFGTAKTQSWNYIEPSIKDIKFKKERDPRSTEQ